MVPKDSDLSSRPNPQQPQSPEHLSDVTAAWRYHRATKHSYVSVRSDAHELDFSNQPIPFKVYRDLPPLPLPEAVEASRVPALDAIAASDADLPTEADGGIAGGAPLDLAALARLLRFSAGITKRKTYGNLEMLFRAAACTGALYHIDLYAVCGELPDSATSGLAAGVYHYAPNDNALRCLRAGDFRPFLVQASAAEPHCARAPIILVAASTYWRNAWKYRSRTYRHCFWDCGTMLANLLAIAAAHGWPARIVAGFLDQSVNHLLGLDPKREAALALIPLGARSVGGAGSVWGAGSEAIAGAADDVQPLEVDTEPLSDHQVEYPEINAVHAATSFTSAGEVERWRAARLQSSSFEERFQVRLPLPPPIAAALPRDVIEEVIVRRGSSRRFRRRPLSLQQLAAVLRQATQGIPADFLHPFGAALNDLYLIVNDVEGVRPGAYVYHRRRQALELLKQGEFRNQAGRLGLEQALPADAGVNVYFLTDLAAVFARWGGRGYRAAQLDAAICAGKMYLAAYAQGFGASGLTFYDDEVTDFFSPHAAGRSVMFLIALGQPDKLIRRLARLE